MDSITSHPNVDVIWNVWPLTLIVWMPYRLLFNVVFMYFYVPMSWSWFLWDLFWESLTAVFFWLFYMIPEILTLLVLALSSWLLFPIPLFIIGSFITGLQITAWALTVTVPTWIVWLGVGLGVPATGIAIISTVIYLATFSNGEK